MTSYELLYERTEKICKMAARRRLSLLIYVDERRMISFCVIRPKSKITPRKFMLGTVDRMGKYTEF